MTEKMNKAGDDASSRNNVFDSIDFNNFLQQKLLKSSDSANGILKSSDLSLFKSKESFVSGFLSKDWGINPSTKALHADSSGKLPTTVDNSARVQSLTTVPNDHLSNDSKSMIQKSQDWMKFNTLGQHIEIPYSMGMFSSNHDSMNQSKVSLLTQNNSSITTNLDESVAKSSRTKDAPKRKRKRAPRKKIIPTNKRYMIPTENDVLMGRGGKSNHHPGNMQYRAEIERVQEQYKKTDDKDEKTSMSEKLVQHVQSYGGNFLEKDDQGWYVIDDIVARRKVSQALREDKDPEKRKAKRQRFLAKRARLQEEASGKGV